jgi:hypothetical protein
LSRSRDTGFCSKNALVDKLIVVAIFIQKERGGS